jgi:hypothetical protein
MDKTERALQSIAEALQNQTEILKALGGDKTKAAATTHTAVRLHGIGGIFSTCGLERDVITAHVRPHGLAARLPWIPNNSEVPYFPSITGFTATTGSQPTTPCEDAPYAFMKGCNLTAAFGPKRFDTNTIDIEETLLQINRGDMTDLVLRGQLLSDLEGGFTVDGLNEQDVLNLVTMAEMVTVGVSFERALSYDLWNGTVAGGSFPGLDAQIATGQIDAQTSTTCPALDSDVKNFNWNDVCGTTLDIVEYLSMLHWYLQYNAETMGLDPVQWVLVMTPNLWYELSACWPCRYMTNRCTDFASNANVVSVNDGTGINMRDRIRREMFLPVNGVEIPVVTDTGIYEYCGDPAKSCYSSSLTSGQYASSIYLVPLTILGGQMQVTYMEYLDYRKARMETNLLQGLQRFFWTDSGRFSWGIEDQKGWCFKLAARTRQRVVLRTPQLAGKIYRVRYTPLQHLRASDPSSPYWQDGGVSLRGYTPGSSVWSAGRIDR